MDDWIYYLFASIASCFIFSCYLVFLRMTKWYVCDSVVQTALFVLGCGLAYAGIAMLWAYAYGHTFRSILNFEFFFRNMLFQWAQTVVLMYSAMFLAIYRYEKNLFLEEKYGVLNAEYIEEPSAAKSTRRI
jgi:hypothetical protein